MTLPVTPNRSPTASNKGSSSGKKPKKDSISEVAGKTIKDSPKTSNKQVNATLWSRIGKCFRKIFSCWSCCFGKKEKDNKDQSTMKASGTIDIGNPVPSGDMFEAVNWVKPLPEATPKEPKPSVAPKKTWKDQYPDYVARDLLALGLSVEVVHKCPDLQLAITSNPIATSDKPYAVHNPIYFKDFPDFKVAVVHQDIFESPAEIIINAANDYLGGGSGIDGAIHSAGGKAYTREHWNLKRHYDGKYTSGYAAIIKDIELNSPQLDEKGKKTGVILKSTKDVIVVAGPKKASTEGKDALYSCYFNSLVLAHTQGKTSIAFVPISTGIFNYPKGAAAEGSLRAIHDFMTLYPDTQLKTIDIHSFNPYQPNPKGDRRDLMFYQDAVNCYPEVMSTEVIDGSKTST